MSFDTLGPGGLDYFPCRYGTSKLLFRGPERDLDEPFVAFLGGTSTYGKFIERPFPELVEGALGLSCLNFGCLNAGIDVFQSDPFLQQAVGEAEVTVLQVLSPRNMSNRFYKVHPRRNDRFLQPTQLLKNTFRDVDFSEFNFTKHMLKRLYQVSPKRFEAVVDELQQAWVSRMNSLLDSIPGKVVLLWFSDHRPGRCFAPDGFDPWFVTQSMLNEVKPKVNEYVEVVASPAAVSAGADGMVFSEMEAHAARHVLGPVAHAETAEALVPVVSQILN